MICKGSPKGSRTAIEKKGWNKKAPVKFQKSVWVHTVVAEEIAVEFVQHKKEKGGDKWVVLSLDNFSAHVAESVKNIFADGHILLVHFLLKQQNRLNRLTQDVAGLLGFTLEICWMNGL